MKMRAKTLLVIAALLLWTMPAAARSKFQFYAERGARSNALGSLSGTRIDVQRSCPGATVNVYLTGTTTAATIYDADGSPISFSQTADSTGSVEFYGDAAAYDVRISSALCGTFTRTIAPVTGSSGGGLVYSAASYGMLCDGTTDTLAAWNTLKAVAKVTGGEIQLPAGTCMTSAKWTIPADSLPLRIRGAGRTNYTGAAGTIIRASAAMTPVVEVLAPYTTLQELRVDGNDLATYGIYCNGCASSVFEDVQVESAIKDGFFADTTGNNNSLTFTRFWATQNGTVYATSGLLAEYDPVLDADQLVTITGTASTTAGNATITIVGSSTDLTTIGARKGDFVRVAGATAADAWVGQIESVTSNTVVTQTIYKPLTTATGQEFAIAIGHGVNLSRAADNNIPYFEKGLFRGNAAAGINVQGIFGGMLDYVQVDNNATFGVAVGLSDGSALTLDTGVYAYFEHNLAGDFWFHQARGIYGAVLTHQGPGPSVRPREDTAGRAIGEIMEREGRRFKLQSGVEQNFVVQITHDSGAGAIQHRIISDLNNASPPQYLDDAITGATTTYTTTPYVTSGVDFAAGAGIDNAAQYRFIFNTAAQGGLDHFDCGAELEGNSSGTPLLVRPTLLSHNVNGTTRKRLVISFRNSDDDSIFDLTTANIASTKYVAARIRCYVKK